MTDDSSCALALKTINAYMIPGRQETHIYLVTLGNFYIAEHKEMPEAVHEFQTRYYLDKTLTKVLWPCPDGEWGGCK